MMCATSHCVFITGGTGYIGQRLIPLLLERGHTVRAMVRADSEKRLPSGCMTIIGDALNQSSYLDQVKPADTFVQLVGVAHPSPSKAAEFRKIDLVAGLAGIAAAQASGVRHFVYLSVAQPAPMMKAYIAVRAECEQRIHESKMNATILRPWYVLGPGHRWPYALIPVYWLLEQLPLTREGAQRLGLITLEQMLSALVTAIENPAEGVRTLCVPELRDNRINTGSAQAADAH
jgi:uncharacterized protein YbjT (DUF2867 family)